MTHLEVSAPDGLPEIGTGSDLAALIAASTALTDGDILVGTIPALSHA